MTEDDDKNIVDIELTFKLPDIALEKWKEVCDEDDTSISDEIQSLLEDHVMRRVMHAGLTLPEGISFEELQINARPTDISHLPDDLPDEVREKLEEAGDEANARGIEMSANMELLEAVCNAHHISFKSVTEMEGGLVMLIGGLYLNHLKNGGYPSDGGNHVLALLIQTDTHIKPFSDAIRPMAKELSEVKKRDPLELAEFVVRNMVGQPLVTETRH